MLISVITVAHNAVQTIGEAVASVAAQDHQELEHILIDGASTDGTVSIARASSSRLSKIISEPDLGIYDAMNKGFRLAQGDIVGLLNADDIYGHTHVLSKVAEVFAADANLDACFADLVYVERDDPQKIVRRWRSRDFCPGLFARGWVPPHPTVYFRRETLHRIGYFDTHFRQAADFEYLLRAFEVQKIRSRHVPGIWVRMRLGGATNKTSSQIVQNHREVAAALRRHRVGFVPFTLACRLMRRIPQFLNFAG